MDNLYLPKILIKLEVSKTDFREIFEFQFSWKFFQWEACCFMRTDGQTEGHDETNGRFSKFCKRDKKKKKYRKLEKTSQL